MREDQQIVVDQQDYKRYKAWCKENRLAMKYGIGFLLNYYMKTEQKND